MESTNNLNNIDDKMDNEKSKSTESQKSQRNTSLFDEYDKHVRRSRLKASLDIGIIDEKEYINEIKGLTIEERSISNFIKEKNEESIALKKYLIDNNEMSQTIEFITKIFEGKTSKFDGSQITDNLIGIAGILAKYKTSAQDINTRLLRKVTEESDEWKKILKEKGYTEEYIDNIKNLTEKKETTNNINIISAAEELLKIRSLIDNYLIEQDNMRKKFNTGKDEQIELLKKYLDGIKNNNSNPITTELEETIKRFLRMIK